jgi:hypothetical protein
MVSPADDAASGRELGAAAKDRAGPIRRQLIDRLFEPNPYDYAPAEIRGQQLAAAQEMFAEMRPKIPVLDQRAKDSGVEEIRSPADLVGLLLSHTSYKSYPQSFVTKGQWNRLKQWLGLVSTENFEDVDLADARDIDDFLDRMWAAGYTISTSSGTSGKVSLLPKNWRDLNIWRYYLSHYRGVLPNNVVADQSRHFFGIGPGSGATTSAYSMGFFCEDFGRPDSRHLLMSEKLSVAKLSRMAELRVKIQNGAAMPEEIQQMEDEARRQQAEAQAQFDALIDTLVAVRHEPVFIQAMTPQLMDLVQRMRDRGVGDGEFHPSSVIGYGGGVKHFVLPADWEIQVKRFFGDVVYSKNYGMSEVNWSCPSCSAGHYHLPPTLVPLVLEEDGSRLIEPQRGLAHGRFGLLDLTTQIRWGGVISADEVDVDLEGECPCGLKSTNVRRVARYSEMKDDDKIQCAASTDAYVRGTFTHQVGL